MAAQAQNVIVGELGRDERPVYEYDLPQEVAAIRDSMVKKSVGMVKITMQEELRAIERAGQNPAKLGYFFAQASLVEVDGRRLDKSVGEDESVLNHTDPIIRALILDAYLDVSTSTSKVKDVFIKSRRVKAG